MVLVLVLVLVLVVVVVVVVVVLVVVLVLVLEVVVEVVAIVDKEAVRVGVMGVLVAIVSVGFVFDKQTDSMPPALALKQMVASGNLSWLA